MLTYWEVNGDRREIDCKNISQCVSETLALLPPTVRVSVCVASIAQTPVNELLLWCLQSTQTCRKHLLALRTPAALDHKVASAGELSSGPTNPCCGILVILEVFHFRLFQS